MPFGSGQAAWTSPNALSMRKSISCFCASENLLSIPVMTLSPSNFIHLPLMVINSSCEQGADFAVDCACTGRGATNNRAINQRGMLVMTFILVRFRIDVEHFYVLIDLFGRRVQTEDVAAGPVGYIVHDLPVTMELEH